MPSFLSHFYSYRRRKREIGHEAETFPTTKETALDMDTFPEQEPSGTLHVTQGVDGHSSR